jgi:hypothetical protein
VRKVYLFDCSSWGVKDPTDGVVRSTAATSTLSEIVLVTSTAYLINRSMTSQRPRLHSDFPQTGDADLASAAGQLSSGSAFENGLISHKHAVVVSTLQHASMPLQRLR